VVRAFYSLLTSFFLEIARFALIGAAFQKNCSRAIFSFPPPSPAIVFRLKYGAGRQGAVETIPPDYFVTKKGGKGEAHSIAGSSR
jgi:hypothetical protein